MSVHSGVSASVHAGIPHLPGADPPGQTPLGADIPWSRHPQARPPRSRHPPQVRPPEADTPQEQTPPRSDTPQSRHPPNFFFFFLHLFSIFFSIVCFFCIFFCFFFIYFACVAFLGFFLHFPDTVQETATAADGTHPTGMHSCVMNTCRAGFCTSTYDKVRHRIITTHKPSSGKVIFLHLSVCLFK